MRNSSLLLLAALFLQTSFANAVQNVPFKQGEKIKYHLQWKGLLLLKINAADLESEITSLDPTTGLMTLKAHVATIPGTLAHKQYATEYNINASMDANTMSTLKYIQRGKEDGANEVKDVVHVCDPKDQSCLFTYHRSVRNKNETKKQGKLVMEDRINIKGIKAPVQGQVQSVISMLYYLRAASLPAKKGATAFVPVLFEDDIFKMHITNNGPGKNATIDGQSYSTNTYIVSLEKTGHVKAPTAADASTYEKVTGKASIGEEGESLQKFNMTIANDPAKTITYAVTKLKVGRFQILLRNDNDNNNGNATDDSDEE